MTIRLALLLAAALLVSTGCVSGIQRDGRIIDPLNVAKIRIGKTTRQDVLTLFGPPTFYSKVPIPSTQTAAPLVRSAGTPAEPGVRSARTLPDDAYLWEYVEDDESFFSFIFLYTRFRRERLVDSLFVIFDDRDRVRNFAYAKQTDAEIPRPEEEEDD